MKLLDTSIIIDDLKKGRFEEGSISVISLLEILRGVSGKKRLRVKQVLENAFEVIGIDNMVIF